MIVTRRRLLCLTATGSLTLAGCTGGGGDGDTESSPTPTPMSTAIQTPTRSSTGKGTQEHYSDYNWELFEDAESVATDMVTLRNSTFNPLVAAVKPGTEVTFTNEDSYGHTVTIPKLDVDKQIGGGQSTTAVVEETGTYDYVCTVHPPDMLGRIVVTEDLPESASTETSAPTETEGGDDGVGPY